MRCHIKCLRMLLCFRQAVHSQEVSVSVERDDIDGTPAFLLRPGRPWYVVVCLLTPARSGAATILHSRTDWRRAGFNVVRTG